MCYASELNPAYKLIHAALSRLTPDTAAATDAPFKPKVLALPGVIEVSDSDATFYIDDEPFDCGEIASEVDCESRMIVMDRHVVYGGLFYDRDTENPLESMDGEGSIFYALRDYTKESRANYQKALGLDSDFCPDYRSASVCSIMVSMLEHWLLKGDGKTFCDQLAKQRRSLGFSGGRKAVIDALRDQVADGDPSHYYVASALFDNTDRELQSLVDPIVDFFNDDDNQDMAYRMAKDRGLIGNQYAILLDVYQHGGTVLSISGEGMNCRWDTSRGAAVWVPGELEMGNINAMLPSDLTGQELHLARVEAAEKYCRGVLETYNAWLSGDCYGVGVYVIDRETGDLLEQDECWGYIGQEYAEEELDGWVTQKVLMLGPVRH